MAGEIGIFGSRRMAVTLEVNRKRIQRLMRILGIEALYPKPNLSRPARGHEVYPYLLRGVTIERPTKSGAPILRMLRCRAASFTWSP
jgi:putative transposase